MIITTMRVRITPENRKELLQTLCSLSDPIEHELGCKSCRIYREVGREDGVMVVQEWRSAQQLNSYFHSNQFAVLVGAMSLLQRSVAVEFKILDQLEASCSLNALKDRHDGS